MLPLQRIAITGVGLATPLGFSVPENVRRSLEGHSGIGSNRTFESAGTPFLYAAQAPNIDISNWLRFPKNSKYFNKAAVCALQATREAISAAAIELEKLDPARIALYTGSGQTGIEYEHFFPALSLAWQSGREMDYKYLGGFPSHLIDRYTTVRTLSNLGVAAISMEYGIQGPGGNFVQSDTAGVQALECACYDLIENRCDLALAGAYDSLLQPSIFLAYHREGLLGDAYRPFDRRRNGAVLGEGAGFLVLERWEDARSRQAIILAEILGTEFRIGAATSFRPAFSPETWRSVIGEVTQGTALDFVMARGIGTGEDDLHEAEILASALENGVPVTALKGLTGYLGAGTAIVELILGLMCARQGYVPPVSMDFQKDPQISLEIVSASPRPLSRNNPVGLFLASSWAGQIAAIAARAIS